MFSRRSLLQTGISIGGSYLLPKFDSSKIQTFEECQRDYPFIDFYTINVHAVYADLNYPNDNPKFNLHIDKEVYSIWLSKNIIHNYQQIIQQYKESEGRHPNTIIRCLYHNRSNILTGIFDKKEVKMAVDKTNKIHDYLYRNKFYIDKYADRLKIQDTIEIITGVKNEN